MLLLLCSFDKTADKTQPNLQLCSCFNAKISPKQTINDMIFIHWHIFRGISAYKKS